MKNVSYDIIEPLIPNDYSEKEYPSKPTIAIHTRDQRDTMKIIKTFYLKYPQYRWITFRDMRGLSQTEFSEIFKRLLSYPYGLMIFQVLAHSLLNQCLVKHP